jgi:hypothetical protein
VDDAEYFSTTFFLVPAPPDLHECHHGRRRKRSVGDGFHEDITISNYGLEPITLDVRLTPRATSLTCSR